MNGLLTIGELRMNLFKHHTLSLDYAYQLAGSTLAAQESGRRSSISKLSDRPRVNVLWYTCLETFRFSA